MERIVKFRLITYFDEVDNPAMPGTSTLVERIASLGEKVDVTRDVDLKRLDSLGALYTEEETAAIEDGSYRGYDRGILENARAGLKPQGVIEDIEGEGAQIDDLSTEDLATHIKEQDLTVDQTLELVGPNPTVDRVNKVLDAENLATENQPRVTLVDALNKLAAEAKE